MSWCVPARALRFHSNLDDRSSRNDLAAGRGWK
jgi:hypothetical protein